MIKLKIVKNKMTIIDDAECTPGQSRLYSRFGEEVLQYIQKNPDAWQAVFNKLDSAFAVKSIKTDPKTDETLVMFTFKGDK
jgi:hypothetical protein